MQSIGSNKYNKFEVHFSENYDFVREVKTIEINRVYTSLWNKQF